MKTEGVVLYNPIPEDPRQLSGTVQFKARHYNLTRLKIGTYQVDNILSIYSYIGIYYGQVNKSITQHIILKACAH